MRATFGVLRIAALIVGVWACVFGAGCAQERPPIDRVNAGVVAKEFFVGNDLSDASDDPTFIVNFLTRVLTMPEPGGFVSSDDDFSVSARKPPEMGLRPIWDVPDFANGPPALTIGIVDGRYISEQYSNTLGGSWDYLNWMDHAGFSVEKQRAISALVDGRPTLYTISRFQSLDGRNNFINFRADLPLATDRIVGGILAGDWESLASYADTSATPTPVTLDLTQATPARPTGARILFPNLGYKMQLATALMVGLHSRLSTDMNLMDKMRIWIDGQIGGITIPDAQQIRFTDPLTGYTYVARKYGADIIDGKTVDKGIASRMIAHANAVLAAAYVVALDVNNKPILDAYGRPALVLDGNGQPQQSASIAPTWQDLVSYVGLLDGVKQIEGDLGYGPLDN